MPTEKFDIIIIIIYLVVIATITTCTKLESSLQATFRI